MGPAKAFPSRALGSTIVFESRADCNKLKGPQSQNRQSSDSAADAVDAEGMFEAFDPAAAYLLQQVQHGHAHLYIAASLLDRRVPDLGLAFAHIEATRRTLELIGRCLSNVELECYGAQAVISARTQLLKQHREMLRRFRDVCRWHRQRSSAMREQPAFV
jgi:hypothetical protein